MARRRVPEEVGRRAGAARSGGYVSDVVWDECVTLIRADVRRLGKGDGCRALLGALVGRPSSRYLVVVRMAAWARDSRRRLPAFVLLRFLWRRWSVRLNLEIPYSAHIGGGLLINHLVGCIVVNAGAEIGQNCTLFHGTTIGARRTAEGLVQSHLGDDVVVSPGAAILGARVGNRCFVASGAVVVRDVPGDSTAYGVPATHRPRTEHLSVVFDAPRDSA